MTVAPPAGSSAPLYQRLAAHYRTALEAGTLQPGERFPSVRVLMRDHGVSLSTALQVCRHLEDQGWLQARPRSGYFVQAPRRPRLPPAVEPPAPTDAVDAAAYVGIHAHVSALLARGEQQPVRVNLSHAVAAPALYPGEALARAMQRLLRQHPTLLTVAERRHGHPALRAVLARRLLARGVHTAPEAIVMTQGASEAVHLALRAVTRPGDTVAVESPTFYGVLQSLESLGLRALELPTSPHTGLSLDALEFALQQHPGGVQAVVAQPTLHNPLGCTMPDAHKQRLAALCAAHDLPLIEDDIYADLGPDDRPIRPVKAWDTTGHVLHCGSFNKVLAPGLRLGFMLPGRWQARVEMLKYTQSRHVEELPQAAVASFVGSSAFDRHVHRLRAALRRQREALAEQVARHFPAGTRLTVPDGGLLLWVQLPEGVHADAVFEAALQRGIKVSPGSMFANSRRFDGCLRLSCGLVPEAEEVEAAVRELGGIVGDLPAR